MSSASSDGGFRLLRSGFVVASWSEQTGTVNVELSGENGVGAVGVLLHPHPHFGGDRFHPFVDELFRRLPARGIGTARFDFSSADPETARDEVIGAIDAVWQRWPDVEVVLIGYSFGAGVASRVADDRLTGWYLLAPPVVLLAEAPIADDRRPKVIAVPARDQYSPPQPVEQCVATWSATTVEVLEGVDHYLGAALSRVVEGAIEGFLN
jgi:alpha/beta superfamily hydrolase